MQTTRGKDILLTTAILFFGLCVLLQYMTHLAHYEFTRDVVLSLLGVALIIMILSFALSLLCISIPRKGAVLLAITLPPLAGITYTTVVDSVLWVMGMPGMLLGFPNHPVDLSSINLIASASAAVAPVAETATSLMVGPLAGVACALGLMLGASARRALD